MADNTLTQELQANLLQAPQSKLSVMLANACQLYSSEQKLRKGAMRIQIPNERSVMHVLLCFLGSTGCLQYNSIVHVMPCHTTPINTTVHNITNYAVRFCSNLGHPP